MDYARGFQMVIHDPRLDNPRTTPPTPLVPPAAQQTWTVNITMHSPEHIFGWAGVVARTKKLDALHIMAHGNRSYVQIGTSGLTANNARVFEGLKGNVRVIAFFSCLVGSDTQGWYWHHPVYYGEKIADITGAKVVVARQNQGYNWAPSTNMIDFGDWEGPVDIYSPGSVESFQEYNPFRTQPKFDLEKLIFG